MSRLGRIVGSDGVDYGFEAPGKWCRHIEQFRTYEITQTPLTSTVQVTCSNCGSAATGVTGVFNQPQSLDRSRQLASDALMKIEAEGAVTEI